MTTLPNGQIIPAAPPLFKPPVQDLQGSALEAASTKTIASQAQLVSATRSLGAGQKGASRKMRKRGGASLNATIPSIPEAGTIRGVSHEMNHLNAVNNLNQIRADASGDSLINAQPIKLGGTKRHRKAKKHGRRSNRTHRRRSGKSSHSRRRRSSHVV